MVMAEAEVIEKAKNIVNTLGKKKWGIKSILQKGDDGLATKEEKITCVTESAYDGYGIEIVFLEDCNDSKNLAIWYDQKLVFNTIGNKYCKRNYHNSDRDAYSLLNRLVPNGEDTSSDMAISSNINWEERFSKIANNLIKIKGEAERRLKLAKKREDDLADFNNRMLKFLKFKYGIGPNEPECYYYDKARTFCVYSNRSAPDSLIVYEFIDKNGGRAVFDLERGIYQKDNECIKRVEEIIKNAQED